MRQQELRFDGETIVPGRDNPRLGKQFIKIRDLMLDGRWRTLEHIAEMTEEPMPSVSARLRDLRKRRFGSYTVERRYVNNGLHEYRIVI
jgi:hypothetical protein